MSHNETVGIKWSNSYITNYEEVKTTVKKKKISADYREYNRLDVNSNPDPIHKLLGLP